MSDVLAKTSVWVSGPRSAGIPVADAASLGPGVCSVLVGGPWECEQQALKGISLASVPPVLQHCRDEGQVSVP